MKIFGWRNDEVRKYGTDCSDFTNRMVNLYLSGYTAEWTPTFRKFERSLVNKETTSDESIKIWNSVAFYNFLQVAMSAARIGGTDADYAEGRVAFMEVINNLQPDLIIVWGVTRLWDNLPGTENGWVDGNTMVVDGYGVLNGYYRLSNGKLSRVIAVYHPSTGYDWAWWYKVITANL